MLQITNTKSNAVVVQIKAASFDPIPTDLPEGGMTCYGGHLDR